MSGPGDVGDRPLPDPAGLCRALEGWFTRSARALPWRRRGARTRRDPYATLVSELMLQQTQAARVAERFGPFLERFPSPAALARADEAEVLSRWSGLGYYRRARHLHAAARAVVERHAGLVPADGPSLRGLPGVGPYTAGAVASLAYDRPEPIVDGNVARVLLRVGGRAGAAGERDTDRWVWARAGDLVRVASSPGDCNEALMELGATVCTPRGPSCDRCPIAERCVAFRDGLQGDIPRPRARPGQRPVLARSVLVRDRRGRVLMERRPDDGMWAGLWQTPTIESGGDRAPPLRVPGVRAVEPEPLETFTYQTTHRLFEVRVHRGTGGRASARRRWTEPAELEELGLSSLQRRVLAAGGLLGGRAEGA